MNALIRPIITEKTIGLAGLRQYTFEVDRRANQIDIAQTAQTMYRVTVMHVNVITISGRMIRRKKGAGQTRSWKKAIITVKSGQKIPGFELEVEQKSTKSTTKETTKAANQPAVKEQ